MPERNRKVRKENGMDDNFVKNETVQICSRTHLNMTFNIFQCGNFDVEPGKCFTTAEDDVFIMFHVNSGAGLLETKPCTSGVEEGFGFVVFPDVTYRLSSIGEETMNITWVAFSGYRAEDYLGRAAIWPARPVFEDVGGKFGKKMNRLYMLSHEPTNRYCKMASVLYDIFGYLRDMRSPVIEEGYKENLNYVAARAVNYIDHNYMHPISVEKIADGMGITRKHLCHVFHKVLNVTPRQYIIFYRMEKACKMLRSTQQSVQEIAEAVGYANQFYFSKEFKRIVNMRPTEYRKSSGEIEIFTWHSFEATLMNNYKFGTEAEDEDWSVKIEPLTELPGYDC